MLKFFWAEIGRKRRAVRREPFNTSLLARKAQQDPVLLEEVLGIVTSSGPTRSKHRLVRALFAEAR